MKANKKKTKRTALIVLCSVLALILAVLIMAVIYVEVLFGRLNRPGASGALESIDLSTRPTDTIPADFTGPIYNDGDIDMLTGPADLIGGDHILNILLIGDDARTGQEPQRSDAMILCSFNTQTKTLTMTSFLRDMYVTIPGYWDDKLNHSYRYGGLYGDGAFELLNATLQYNFGVQIDGNVEVNFEGFVDVVDLVGGVDIDLTAAEARYINNACGSALAGGVNHLNGELALTYARIRYLDSDFGRTNRQRNVLTALVDKAKTLSLTEMNSLLMKLLPLITTDMTNAEITSSALELFPMLKDVQIVTQQIPAEGTYQFAMVNSMSVILVDFEANRQLLKETIGG